MKIIFTILVVFLFIGISLGQQPIFEENFDYPANTDLSLYGWTTHSGSGSNPIEVVSPGLVYTGYPGTGIGNAAGLDGSGDDLNKNFPEQGSGTVYVAFMVNVSAASSAGTYFLHLGPTNMGFTFVGKVFVKSDGANIVFGVSKRSTSAPTYATTTHSPHTTYLVILKYSILSGGTDDEVSLFVFSDPELPATEPASPLIGPITDTNSDPANLGTVALRQGSGGPTLSLDGIRIGTTWASVISGTATNPPVISNLVEDAFPANQPIDITCDVTIASGTIDFVRLLYYTDLNTATLDSVAMTASGGDQYSATLTGLPNATSLIYWVKAKGNGIVSLSAIKKIITGIPDIGIFHTQLDTNGLPLHMDHLVRLRGLVTVASGIFSTTNYDFYMQDNTGGINVFQFNMGTTIYNEGDSLELVGNVDHYNGKVEIVNFKDHEITVLSTGNPLPAAIDVNIEDMGEEFEGRLIQINNVSLSAGSDPWPTTPNTSANLTITDGTGELTLRIAASTNISGNPEPTWPVTVTGIGNQYDFSAPYDEGYQIQPRYYADFSASAITGEEPLIFDYHLAQNYPNPFNPETAIAYRLKKTGMVEFTVYNLLGEKVYSFSGVQQAGAHRIVFDGSHLTSGIYFYQLKSGDFRAVKKMVLSK